MSGKDGRAVGLEVGGESPGGGSTAVMVAGYHNRYLVMISSRCPCGDADGAGGCVVVLVKSQGEVVALDRNPATGCCDTIAHRCRTRQIGL